MEKAGAEQIVAYSIHLAKNRRWWPRRKHRAARENSLDNLPNLPDLPTIVNNPSNPQVIPVQIQNVGENNV
jgi:hypothetical protein